MIKRILYISLWIIGVAALIAFEIYAIDQYGKTACDELQIELINPNKTESLTSVDELRTEILQNHLPIEGQDIKNINLRGVEKNISRISYIDRIDAFVHINGNLKIRTSPRKAILRIYNTAEQHFYLGSDTVIMPLSTKHSLRILFANGHLPQLANSYFNQSAFEPLQLPDIYKKLYILAAKIQEDDFLKALIDQIYVKDNQEFELIPKTGVGLIEFGDIEGLDDKLKRLKIFYTKGKVNWTLYKSINLKYKNQVVCTKK